MCVPAYAADEDGAEPYGLPDGFAENIPSGALEYLPDGIAEGDASAGEIADLTGADFIFGSIAEMMRESFMPALGFLSSLLSAVLISSAAGLIFRSMSDGRMSAAVTLITCLTLAVFVASSQERIINDLSSFASTLSTFTAATVPMMAGLLSASGNTSGAAVTSSGLLLFASAVEFAVSAIFIPIIRLGFALAVISSVSGEETNIGGICELIKKTFSWLAAGAAMIYATVLSYQSAIAASADTLAARGIKYTVGSAVPVVGGALSDAVRTTAASLAVIKNGSGVVGIVVLLLLVLPILISIMYSMTSLGIASFAASMLGCERESAFLSEVRSVLGFAAASVVLIAFVFVFALAVYMKTAPALGS